MPKPCSVCTHTKRQDIDRALLAGVSYRTVSAQFGPSPSALCRHVRHLARYLDKWQHSEDMKYNRVLLDKLDLLEIRLGKIYNDAHERKALRIAVDCIKEHMKVISLMERFRDRSPEQP